MIKALIFDLDGTLIQTEVLKATSYARALQGLTGNEVSEQRVMEVFGNYVGLSRKEVVKGLSEEFASELRRHVQSMNPNDIQKKVITKRLALYQEILNNGELLAQHFCPYTLSLLKKAHTDRYHIILATMSHLEQVEKIIAIMGIEDRLDGIFTREDVAHGKPDPEIYLKAKDHFDLRPEECVVIEDSVNGIKAGLAAGMHVIAVTNDVTRRSVHAGRLLRGDFIIDDLKQLVPRVYRFIEGKK